MMADVVTLDVTIGRRNDGHGTEALCSCELLPELLGHGETEDDAVQDLQSQYNAIVWH